MTIKSMAIEGMGILSAGGRGLASFDERLRQGWVPPSPSDASHLAYRIDPKTIVDRDLFRNVKRADRYSKMAVLSARDALVDSGLPIDGIKNSMGIIISSAFGSHATTSRFVEDIIEFGDDNASPTIFSHSIHNAAASYVATSLKCEGPTFTVTQFYFSFPQALLLAYSWLSEGRCERVLVGSLEECGKLMEYVCSQKLSVAPDGKIKPLACSTKPVSVPGEGSVFFMLSLDESRKKYGTFTDVSFGNNGRNGRASDLTLLNSSGMIGDESVYRKAAGPGAAVAGYSPVYGSMMTGGSFECAAAALMLHKQVRYACPVSETSRDWQVDTETKAMPMNEIQCVTYDCVKEKACIKLGR